MSALPAREGYRLWAPRYAAETAVSWLENSVLESLGVPVAGRSLLDVGCGTARRMIDSGALEAVGVDLTPEMLARAGAAAAVAAAQADALPLPGARFDVVWCRLMMGHLRDPAPAYRELGRVCRPGGRVIVSDFHPDAARAGHTRSFRDADGVVREVEHHVHDVDRHVAAARDAGLEPVAQRDGRVGQAVRPFYAAAGRLSAYDEQIGLPLVLVLEYRRAP